MRRFESPHELRDVIGERLGESEWLTVTQSMIDDFANATGDRQWIHVDVEAGPARDAGGDDHRAWLPGDVAHRRAPADALHRERAAHHQLRHQQAPLPSPRSGGARIRSTETIRAVEEGSGGLRVASELTIELEAPTSPPWSPKSCSSTSRSAEAGRRRQLE